MRHGIVKVRSVAVGKSAVLRILFKALERTEGVKGELYVIDPKAFDKDAFYGSLDGTMLEFILGHIY
jgi:dynein heavy chain 1